MDYIAHVIRKMLQITAEFRVFWRILESLLRSIRRQRGRLTAWQHGEPKTSAILNEDVILDIMDYLDDHDKIASAYTCQWFTWIFQNNPRLMRKLNLSKCIAKRQQSTIRKLLQDEQMFQHITELNLNNQRMRDGQMRLNIENFIISICSQLEALHVMNCGLSFKTLHRVLQSAPKLTAFSFSITDFSKDDAADLMMFFNDIHLETIRKLNIESLLAVTHIHILKYLVLSCCKFLEELEICMWDVARSSEHIVHSVLGNAEFLHRQSAEPLQHFHSLTVRTADVRRNIDTYDELAEPELHEFVVSVVKKKSRKMKWKKLWISPLSDSLFDQNEDLFSLTSVEAFAANNEFQEGKLKSLFPKMNDRVVRKFQLHHIKEVQQFHRSIARIGGDTLRNLSLSFICEYRESEVPSRLALNSLFSACSNIRELSLLSCHFEGTICKYLSKLEHLVRVQLQQCAIAPDHLNKQVMDEGNVEMLTFVESCPNIKEFDLRGCMVDRCYSQHFIVNSDLFPIAKWTKLESLTCCSIELNTKQVNQKPVTGHSNGFLRIVAQNCKFLQTLRIAMEGYDDEPNYLAFLEHTKQLKHLAFIDDVDLSSEDVWKLLSSMTNLERICIQSFNEEPLSIANAVEMIQNLPRLHVLHLHLNDVNNVQDFHKQIMRTLEEEPDRIFHFEFYIEDDWLKSTQQSKTDQNVLPLNISELCFTTPCMK